MSPPGRCGPSTRSWRPPAWHRRRRPESSRGQGHPAAKCESRPPPGASGGRCCARGVRTGVDAWCASTSAVAPTSPSRRRRAAGRTAGRLSHSLRLARLRSQAGHDPSPAKSSFPGGAGGPVPLGHLADRDAPTPSPAPSPVPKPRG